MDLAQVINNPTFQETTSSNTPLSLDSIYRGIYTFFNPHSIPPDTYNFVLIGDVINTVLVLLIIFFLTMIFYCSIRLFEIRKKEHEHLHHEIIEYAHHHAHKEKKLWQGFGPKAPDWEKVLKLLLSDSEGDWKQAIMNADNILDDLTVHLDFKGESLGDRLMNADRDTFKGLSTAWEVHTIRNKIAHEGGDFVLTLREAKRVIALYEQIFSEFGYI